jgi:hypothetical protein
MSDEPKHESWPHPLLPWLTEIAKKATPLIPFTPPEDIEREIAMTSAAHPLLASDEAKRIIIATYRHSSIAAMIVGMNGGSELDGEELHSLLFVAAQGHPLAAAFCDAAGHAYGLGMMPSFAAATRLPGFVPALKDWARHFEYEKPFHGPERLRLVLEEIIESGAPGAEFWQGACRMGYDNQSSFNRALGEEYRKYDDAARKRKNHESSGLKNRIAFGWLPASLWARRCDSILAVIDPRSSDAIKASGRVRRVIGKGEGNLNFTSHQSNFEKFIENAETVAKKDS